jgi:hypothetical protein
LYVRSRELDQIDARQNAVSVFQIEPLGLVEVMVPAIFAGIPAPSTISACNTDSRKNYGGVSRAYPVVIYVFSKEVYELSA